MTINDAIQMLLLVLVLALAVGTTGCATTQEIESFSYTPVLVTESFTLNSEPLEVVVP